MTLRIKEQTGNGLIDKVQDISGVSLSTCYQCGKCANGCPVAPHTDTSPSEIVRRLQLGAGEEILDSDIIWMCLSCEMCYARCPMNINVCAVMDALRTLALARGAADPAGAMPLFNRMFLGTVKNFGRAYDLAMIAAYKLGTRTFTNDVDKFPAMLKKGKMALLPPSGADRGTVQRIFRETQPDKGKKK